MMIRHCDFSVSVFMSFLNLVLLRERESVVCVGAGRKKLN